MKAYEGIAAALVSEGVDTIFGVLAADNMWLIHELVQKHGIRYIAARHEQAAVGMADGFSRATGKVGVAAVTLGPGLTNAGTTMTAARLSGSRVLVIAGDKARGSRFGNMDIDQLPFIMATAGALQEVTSPENLASEVQLAFRRLRLRPAPIVLDIPMNILESPLPAEWNYRPSATSAALIQAPSPDELQVSRAREMLAASARPVILAGRGAVYSGAREALVALAERVGAVLATTLPARDWFQGLPFNLGVCGGFSDPGVREILRDADLVLAFGASLNHWTLDKGHVFPQANLIQVDLDPIAFGSYAPVSEAILADARATAIALLENLGQGPAYGWADAKMAARIASIDQWEDSPSTAETGYVSRQHVARACNELLPPERIVAVGVGHFMGAPGAHMSVTDGRNLILPWRLGAAGSGLPPAIGAAVGRPETVTVLFEGDGGLMMSLSDLDTPVRYGLRLLVVCYDDGGFAAERILLKQRGLSPSLADYENPDFTALAASLGYRSYQATSNDAFTTSLQKLLPIDSPSFIHVKTHPDELDERFERALH